MRVEYKGNIHIVIAEYYWDGVLTEYLILLNGYADHLDDDKGFKFSESTILEYKRVNRPKKEKFEYKKDPFAFKDRRVEFAPESQCVVVPEIKHKRKKLTLKNKTS